MSARSPRGSVGIVVYVPDTPVFLRELRILAHSIAALQADGIDLLVYAPSALIEQARRIPALLVPWIVLVPYQGGDGGEYDYHFLNSIECMTEPGHRAQLSRYEFLLRSDTDALLLPGFASRRPDVGELIVGEGGYNNDQLTADRLREIASELGMHHSGRVNLGSTWFGRSKDVLQVAGWTVTATRAVLRRFPPGEEGAWPSWFRGVALLYGGEIALNHWVYVTGGILLRDVDRFDYSSASWNELADRCHVHCWHVEVPFSKFVFQEALYGSRNLAELEGEQSVRRYCLSMALAACPEHSWDQAIVARCCQPDGIVHVDKDILPLFKGAIAASRSTIFVIGEEPFLFHGSTSAFYRLSVPALMVWGAFERARNPVSGAVGGPADSDLDIDRKPAMITASAATLEFDGTVLLCLCQGDANKAWIDALSNQLSRLTAVRQAPLLVYDAALPTLAIDIEALSRVSCILMPPVVTGEPRGTDLRPARPALVLEQLLSQHPPPPMRLAEAVRLVDIIERTPSFQPGFQEWGQESTMKIAELLHARTRPDAPAEPGVFQVSDPCLHPAIRLG